MRADRLVATLLLMQARGRVTAAEVAAELEVSLATARRDLEALSTAGVPVYAQPGRGGGWSLVGGARTDLTGLTSTEAKALFLLAGPASSVTPAVRSALRKLVRALPETFRAEAQAAADAVVVDATRWGERDRTRPELVELLQDAVVSRRLVQLTYEGRGRDRTSRVVDPWGLVDKDDIWYLVAGTPKGQRTFRVDRIAEASLTDQPGARPADFRLSDAWGQVVREVEQRRSLLSATVLIPTHLLPVLRDQFGRHCETLGPFHDGRLRVRVAAPLAISIAETIAGWGATVEVVEPESVRVELARLGSELVARYGWARGSGPTRHTARMANDEALADRVRELLVAEPDLVEKKMFGGLAFMVGGHLAIAASSQGGLMLRADPEISDALLTDPRVEPFEMYGRSMKGWLHVAVDASVAAEDLQGFVDHGLATVRSLPPK